MANIRAELGLNVAINAKTKQRIAPTMPAAYAITT